MYRFSLLFIGLLFVTQLGCSSNPISSVPTSGTIKISIKSVSTASSNNALGKTAAAVTITSARVIIDEIELESIFDDTLDFEFEQPFVQDLMAGSSNIYEIGTIQVPFGSYKEMEIEVDDLKAEDGAVYTQNPELQDLSIRVEGYLNGDTNNTFVFTSDLDEEQEREFNPLLIVDENSPSTSIVLTIDMDTWFMDSNGTPLDPGSPNNKSIIENNIKDSIDVFEDEDDDGERDD